MGRRFVFAALRGGRPCPPAENASFYGNPMRIRNISMGRCGHRPLQKTSQDFTILEGGQGRPPLQRVLDRPCGSCEKSPRFPSYAVGVDAYIDPPETPVFTEIRCEIAALGFCQLPASSVQRMTGAPVQKSVPFCTVTVPPRIRSSYRPSGSSTATGADAALSENTPTKRLPSLPRCKTAMSCASSAAARN